MSGRFAQLWPFGLLGLGLFGLLLAVRYGVRRAGLGRRPVLLAALALAVLPPLYVALVWGRLLGESYLRFGRPWATLVGLAAMGFAALRLGRHRPAQSRLRLVLSDALCALAVLASAFAATSPELGRPLDRLTVVVVIDRSRSIDLVPHAEQRISRELAAAETSMRDEDTIGTVAFGSEAATEDPPRPRSSLPAPQRADLGRDGTDIGMAIRRALAEVPADSAARLVLLSDGVPTRGDAMSAAAAAVASEIPIDVVPLEQREVPDLRVVSFRAPPRAQEREALDMRLVVASPEPGEIEIRLSRDGQLLRRLKTSVVAGEDVLRLSEPAPSAGLHRYDIALSALDSRLDSMPEDNEASSFVRVRGPARALVLDGDRGMTRFVARALADAGLQTDEGSTSSVPAEIGAMAGYDLIVLGDVPARDLAPSQIDALASYVRDLGGGLLLTAGDRSLGPGGYARTPLEEISPVSFDLKQERRRASLAEVIAIDFSGSMSAHAAGHTKLELANEGAVRSAQLLGAGDLLGIEHVDTEAHWCVPLGPVVDQAAIESAIRGVTPGGGGIFTDLALEQAYAEIAKPRVNLKHVLLFADGSDAENLGPKVHGLVREAHARGVTTSIVALGQGEMVPELEQLTREGEGRFYIVEDATRLPAVFTQETILASRSAIVEDPFRVALGASSPATAGIDFATAPALEGYVVTIPKSRASVLLTGPENDPILAVWSAGVGHAATFASDLKDRWGRAWTGWEGAARLVAQLGRQLSRLADDSRVRLEADTARGQLELRADVVDDDGRLQSFRRLRARISGPDGFSRDVPLEAAGPGAYTASVPLSRPGAYIAVARDELTSEPVATTGAVLGSGEELRPTGTDYALLNRLAELTGGKKRDTLAGIFADRAGRRFAYQDVTSPALCVAAFALLLMVGARRLAMPDGAARWGRKALGWRPWARPAADPAAATVGAGAPELLASLLKSKEDKQRARQGDAPPQVGPAELRPLPSPPPSPAAPVPPPTGVGEPWPELRAPAAARPASLRPARRVPPSAAPDAAAGSPASSRPLTAVEILLARRKAKRS